MRRYDALGSLIASKTSGTALINAVHNESFERVTHLARKCVNINFSGDDDMTALQCAFWRCDMSIIHALLVAGANPNVGTLRCVPLVFASMYGRDDIAAALLRASADVEVHDNNGWTVLGIAACYGHIKVVRMLVDAGANPDAMDGHGTKPLEHACEGRMRSPPTQDKSIDANHRMQAVTFHWDVAQFLVSRGASVSHTTSNELHHRMRALHARTSALVLWAHRKQDGDFAALPLEIVRRILNPLEHDLVPANAPRVSPFYMEMQPQLNMELRFILCDWMYDATRLMQDARMTDKERSEVVHRATAFVDWHLSRKHVARNNLQLVGMAAMRLASLRVVGTRSISNQQLCSLTQEKFTVDDLCSMQRQVLVSCEASEFRVGGLTMRDILAWRLDRCGATVDARKRADYLADLTLMVRPHLPSPSLSHIET